MKRWILPGVAVGLAAVIVLPFVVGAGGGTVEIKGKTFNVEHITGDSGPYTRRSPVRDRGTLAADRAILCSWDRDRYLYFFSDRATGVFDVAFLDAAGKILEVRRLRSHRGDHCEDPGVTSKAEARRALFLPEGTADNLTLSTGDTVVLSPDLASAAVDPMPVIKVAGNEIRVEINYTAWDRNRGLMHRHRMSKDEGMLFVYPKAEPHLSFYMRNTWMGLDIAYFDEVCHLTSVHPTEPSDDPPRLGAGITAASKRPSQLVLEMPIHWFRDQGLTDDSDKPLKEVKMELPDAIRGKLGSADPH